jgi:hypothetical protein
MSRFDQAIATIDAANAEDPNLIDVRGTSQPLALAHGRLASEWVAQLRPDAPEAVVLAARAHHLRRWEVPRASYPVGRAAYLRWRRDQKARHARDVEAILAGAGYAPNEIERVQSLIRREGLGSDPETQLVEDAACLVFVETQLVSTAAVLDHDHLVSVLHKTARKMSPAALAALPNLELSADARAILTDAFGGTQDAT